MRQDELKNWGIWALLLFTAGLLLTSCSTQQRIIEMPVEVVKHDSMWQVVHQRDSIHIKDSVVVKGDTVERYRDRYVERRVHDTLRIHESDTIPVPIKVTEFVEVEHRESRIDKALRYVGMLAIAIFLAFCLANCRKISIFAKGN